MLVESSQTFFSVGAIWHIPSLPTTATRADPQMAHCRAVLYTNYCNSDWLLNASLVVLLYSCFHRHMSYAGQCKRSHAKLLKLQLDCLRSNVKRWNLVSIPRPSCHCQLERLDLVRFIRNTKNLGSCVRLAVQSRHITHKPDLRQVLLSVFASSAKTSSLLFHSQVLQ